MTFSTALCMNPQWLNIKIEWQKLIRERMKNKKVTSANFDGLVKSLQGRHSRERGSPEAADFPGFPRSRE